MGMLNIERKNEFWKVMFGIGNIIFLIATAILILLEFKVNLVTGLLLVSGYIMSITISIIPIYKYFKLIWTLENEKILYNRMMENNIWQK